MGARSSAADSSQLLRDATVNAEGVTMDTEQKTEQANVNTDAQGGGQQPGKTFTQAELEAILAERLSRQKAQFADYADLKAKSQKWDEVEAAQKTETQRLTEAKAKAERERDEALQRAQARLIRAAFIAEAAKAGAAHPEDVLALADTTNVKLDDSDNVVGVAEAVQAVIAAGRVPTTAAQRAPSLDAGAGGGKRADEQKRAALTEQELEQARKLRITPEQYAKNKAGR